MRARILLVAGAVALLMSSREARADGERAEAGPARAARRTLLLESAAGVGTPVGWLGASGVVMIARRVALHAGGGFGSQGLQLEAGARYRVLFDDVNAVALGGSWSSGAFVGAAQTIPLVPEMWQKHPTTYVWDRAHFANVELSLEHDAGWAIVRGFGGLGFVVAGDARVANAAAFQKACDACARVVPFLGVALDVGVL